MLSMSFVHCELILEPQFSPWLVAGQEAAGGNALVQLAAGPGPMTSLTQRSVLQGQVSAEARYALKLCGPFSMGHGQPVGLGHIRDLPGHSISCTPSSVFRHFAATCAPNTGPISQAATPQTCHDIGHI